MGGLTQSQALQKSYKSLVIQEARVGRKVTECSMQRNPKSKSTPAARAARHSRANWKRMEAHNVVLDHWYQNAMVIVHSLGLSLFMSSFLVLPVLTGNDTEQNRIWFPKWPHFHHLCGNKRAQELTLSSVPCWYLSKGQRQLLLGVNTYPQMQANYANKAPTGWIGVAAW